MTFSDLEHENFAGSGDIEVGSGDQMFENDADKDDDNEAGSGSFGKPNNILKIGKGRPLLYRFGMVRMESMWSKLWIINSVPLI